MNVVLVGHVDHGKSTLVGRLLYETGSVPEGRYAVVAKVCEDSGKQFEFAFLLDALEEERDQGITIDTTQFGFHTATRDYVLIDAPGHKEFLKNMVTGASSAEAAIILVDAAEGIQEQTRRHGYLVHLLGIRQIAVVINKMDLVEYAEEVFERLRRECKTLFGELGVHPQFIIPVAARAGENVSAHGESMPWYDGPTVVDALDGFGERPQRHLRPLRFPVQDVYKFDHRRILAGRVESGHIAEGDTILFSPSGRTAQVKSIERWQSPNTGPASAGESIGITLTEPLFIERGEIISHEEQPPLSGARIQTRLFWMGNRHLVPGRDYTLKLVTQEIPCQVASIGPVVDTASLQVGWQSEVGRNEVATVSLDPKRPVAYDEFSQIEETGRFVLVDGFDVAGGGILLPPADEDYTI